MQTIKIEVSGKQEDRQLALAGLIEGAEYCELKKAVRSLSTPTLVRLAQTVHGAMYNELGV